MSILQSIDKVVGEYRAFILEESNRIHLPHTLPVEIIPQIKEYGKTMRILVMLNPTNKRGTKTAYTAFRKFLASDGYVLWGPEIYMRVVTNRKSADIHIRRLQATHPDTGMIRVLRLTEKQFSSMLSLTETIDFQEEIVGAKEIVPV